MRAKRIYQPKCVSAGQVRQAARRSAELLGDEVHAEPAVDAALLMQGPAAAGLDLWWHVELSEASPQQGHSVLEQSTSRSDTPV